MQLTPEDEERRRRRRERNKIAATKCRLKKRERIANLVTESETLENQNIDLKTQIQELERTRLHLVEILTLHRPHCQKNIPTITRDHVFRRLPPLPPVSCVIETNHSYNNRTSSIEVNYHTQNNSLDIFNRHVNNGEVPSYTRNLQYIKPPSIIIDGTVENYEPQLTNLDNPVSEGIYNNQQCHNYNSNQNYSNQGMDNGLMA